MGILFKVLIFLMTRSCWKMDLCALYTTRLNLWISLAGNRGGQVLNILLQQQQEDMFARRIMVPVPKSSISVQTRWQETLV